MTFFTEYFNTRSHLWYTDSGTTPEGNEIENLISSVGLHQIVKEPTNLSHTKPYMY